MHDSELSALACVSLLVFGPICMAKETPTLTLADSPTGQVGLAPFNMSQFPAFRVFFAGHEGDLQRAAFIIQNKSDRPIIGVAVKWTTIAQDGSAVSHTSRTQMYLSAKPAPVVMPNGGLLVAPDMFIPESIVTSGGGVFGATPDRRSVSKFTSGSPIHATVDCIIFGDGEVVGPDETKLVQDIQSRQAALNMVLNQVHVALANGQDPSSALTQLMASPRPSSDRLVGSYVSLFVHELLATRHRGAVISNLKGMPPLVTFFRKDGGAL